MQLVTQPAIPVPKPNELRLVEQQIQAPRCADDVHLQPSMSAHHKQEVLAMVRTCITVRTNAAQHIKLLAEHAQLIPITSFAPWCWKTCAPLTMTTEPIKHAAPRTGA